MRIAATRPPRTGSARGLFNDKSWSRPGRHLHGPDSAPLGRKTERGRVMAGSSVARVPPGAETGTSRAPGRLLGSVVPQEPLLPAPRPCLCDPPVRSPGSSPVLPRCPPHPPPWPDKDERCLPAGLWGSPPGASLRHYRVVRETGELPPRNPLSGLATFQTEPERGGTSHPPSSALRPGLPRPGPAQ